MRRRRAPQTVELLHGTLDMLILKTLLLGPMHGRGVANSLRQSTDSALSVEHGSLYPALHRLQRAQLIAGTWEVRSGSTRELKYYRLTTSGRAQLRREESKWDQLVAAITRIMRPAEA